MTDSLYWEYIPWFSQIIKKLTFQLIFLKMNYFEVIDYVHSKFFKTCYHVDYFFTNAPLMFTSLGPGRCDSNFKSGKSKHYSRFKFMCASCEIHLRTSLMVRRHWFRWWLNAIRQQAINWANVDTDLCCHMASLSTMGLHKEHDVAVHIIFHNLNILSLKINE